jgi:hypothetical protein
LVREAVPPELEWLYRLDQRVVLLLPVFSSMSILGVVTATDLAADETSPEMDPGVAHLHTLIAYVRGGFGSGAELFEMLTFCRRHRDGRPHE